VSTLRARHYDENVNRLKADPIVIAMAEGLRGIPMSDLCHDDGGARHEFMMAANREYMKRAGHGAEAHIGGVSEALLALLKEKA
jgi:hypothetical protein